MTEQEVSNTLPKDPYGMNYVYLELYGAMISPSGFVEKFGGENSSLTFDWLYNHENATPSWNSQFEVWNEQGII